MSVDCRQCVMYCHMSGEQTDAELFFVCPKQKNVTSVIRRHLGFKLSVTEQREGLCKKMHSEHRYIKTLSIC